MADTVPAQFSFTLLDEFGTKGVCLVNALIDPAATITSLNAQWSNILGLLDLITSGQIIGSHYRVLPVITGVKTAPVAGSRIEQSAVFNFSASGTGYKQGVLVPSIRNTMITAGKIDLTNADVIAFFTALVTAVAGVLEWTSANRQALLALLDALLSFRKHRKQLARSSFEEA